MNTDYNVPITTHTSVALLLVKSLPFLLFNFNDKSALGQVRLHTSFFDVFEQKKVTTVSETKVSIVHAFGGRFQTGKIERRKLMLIVDSLRKCLAN